jgi:hypothetical protein
MQEMSAHLATQETQERTDQPELAERAVQQEHLETQETQANKVALAAEGEAEALSIPP